MKAWDELASRQPDVLDEFDLAIHPNDTIEELEWLHNEIKERYPGPECAQCGEHFEPKRSDSRYCSSACRQKAYRERSAGG